MSKDAPSVNDTLRNVRPIMDFALKDDTLVPPSSPRLSPSFSRRSNSKRRGKGGKKYHTVSVFPRSLVEATAAMLVTTEEEDKP